MQKTDQRVAAVAALDLQYGAETHENDVQIFAPASGAKWIALLCLSIIAVAGMGALFIAMMDAFLLPKRARLKKQAVFPQFLLAGRLMDMRNEPGASVKAGNRQGLRSL